MMLEQRREMQGVEPATSLGTEPLATFLRKAGRAASEANLGLLEARARLAMLASPELEERAALHKLTLAQTRVEIRRMVGRTAAKQGR
jgi:hypothetical protein